MPLLALEPNLFPPNLFESNPPSGTWWALHTRPRSEKTLARRLLDRGISFYLPLYRREWRSGGRDFRSFLPLFPGYVFLNGDAEDRVRALETNLIVLGLIVPDQPQLWIDLMRVHRLLNSGAPVTPEERLEPGDPVEIIAGPFAGIEGKLLKRGKHLRLLVEVHFLGRAVSAEVENGMVRPLPR